MRVNSEQLSQWFQKISKETNFVSNGPVKGTMIMSPTATKIWNNIKEEFIRTVLKTMNNEVEEVIFPTLLPKSMFEEEKSHIEGFSPELWKIKRKDSPEEIVLRPTSEVIFNKYFASRSFTYKELPILWNQWANVFRVEENVKPFLRTSEFIWQEGHTFHETEREAREMAIYMMNKYNQFMQETLLLPTYKGEKTIAEKFAGAKRTYGVESVMIDGQSVQIATSHDLNNNFTKVFKGTYKTGGNTEQLAYGSSWGFSTRAMGAMLLMHGDESGFVVPSKIAAYQIVFITFDHGKWSENEKQIFNKFQRESKFRIKVIDGGKNSGTLKWNYLKQGTPIIINIGKRDMDLDSFNVITRVELKDNCKLDNIFKNSIEKVESQLESILNKIDIEIKNRAIEKTRLNLIFSISKSEAINSIKEGKHVLAYTSLRKEEEIALKKEHGFSVRVIIDENNIHEFNNINVQKTNCIFTSKENAKLCLISRAY